MVFAHLTVPWWHMWDPPRKVVVFCALHSTMVVGGIDVHTEGGFEESQEVVSPPAALTHNGLILCGGDKVMWFHCSINWREMCNRNLPALRAERQGAGGKSLDNHLILAGKAKTGFWQAHIRGQNVLPSRWQVIGYSPYPVWTHIYWWQPDVR